MIKAELEAAIIVRASHIIEKKVANDIRDGSVLSEFLLRVEWCLTDGLIGV